MDNIKYCDLENGFSLLLIRLINGVIKAENNIKIDLHLLTSYCCT